MTDGLKAFADAIRAAGADKKPLRLRGGGSKDFYGQALEGAPLDCRGHTGILAYEPTELVVTAKCGTPLSELDATLAANAQMLAFEPPTFGTGATVGGMVAAGLSGPRRAAAGAVRDYVLGVAVMDARGKVMRFGGTVMKNVAGYDVSRLFAGSMGTLGLILDVSLKVLPLPLAEATVRFEMPENKAIETLNRWAGKPLPISASAWSGGELSIRLSGAEAAVRSACDKLEGERVDAGAAGAYWIGIRNQSDPYFGTAMPLWRLSVPSTTPPLALPGAQMIEWGGALRWLVTQADARIVRDAARRAGGHATLFRGGDKAAGVFQPLDPALAKIHRKLKASFDPEGIFNRGRMYPDF